MHYDLVNEMHYTRSTESFTTLVLAIEHTELFSEPTYILKLFALTYDQISQRPKHEYMTT